jgi:hypothetical protein
MVIQELLSSQQVKKVIFISLTRPGSLSEITRLASTPPEDIPEESRFCEN